MGSDDRAAPPPPRYCYPSRATTSSGTAGAAQSDVPKRLKGSERPHGEQVKDILDTPPEAGITETYARGVLRGQVRALERDLVAAKRAPLGPDVPALFVPNVLRLLTTIEAAGRGSFQLYRVSLTGPAWGTAIDTMYSAARRFANEVQATDGAAWLVLDIRKKVLDPHWFGLVLFGGERSWLARTWLGLSGGSQAGSRIKKVSGQARPWCPPYPVANSRCDLQPNLLRMTRYAIHGLPHGMSGALSDRTVVSGAFETAWHSVVQRSGRACSECGRSLIPGCRSDKRWCSARCKMRSWRAGGSGSATPLDDDPAAWPDEAWKQFVVRANMHLATREDPASASAQLDRAAREVRSQWSRQRLANARPTAHRHGGDPL